MVVLSYFYLLTFQKKTQLNLQHQVHLTSISELKVVPFTSSKEWVAFVSERLCFDIQLFFSSIPYQFSNELLWAGDGVGAVVLSAEGEGVYLMIIKRGNLNQI